MVAADLSPTSSGALQPQQEQEQSQLQEQENKADIDNSRSPFALSEKSNVAGLRKPRNREITSRYKIGITAAAASSAAPSNGVPPVVAGPRRHPSPTLGRNTNPAEVPVVKRAISAERRRPWPATTSSVDPKVALNSSTDSLWSSKRPVGRTSGSGSGSGLLWPSSQSQNASLQADSAASLSNGNAPPSRRESFSREASSSRPQTPARDARSQTSSAKDGRPQTPVRDGGRPQNVAKEARPQTPPPREARPQTPPFKEPKSQVTPVKDARPQTPTKDGRPQTPGRDGGLSRRESASKEAVPARKESPKRDVPRRDSPQRERGLGSETALRPTANGVLRTADTSSGPPSRKGSPLRRPSTDQSENARPVENSPSKPDFQRWPGTSNAKSFGPAMSRSVDLGSDRDRSLSRAATMLVQSQPGSGTSSRPVKLVVSRSFSKSSNEGPAAAQGPQGVARRVSTENRVKGRVSSDSNRRLGGPQDGAQNTSAAGANIGSDGALSRVRQVQQETELAGSDGNAFGLGENGSDTDSVSSNGSAGASKSSLRGTVVAARFWQHTTSKGQRVSEGVRLSMSEQDLAAALVPGSKAAGRQSKAPLVGSQSVTNTMVSSGVTAASALSPARPVPSALTLPQTPGSPSKPSSPSRGLPSPTRQRLPSAALPPSGSSSSRISSAMCMLNFGVDSRRGKRTMTQQEEGQLLRVLHNRWLQWRFVNARAEAALHSQSTTAERSLYSVWMQTSELRESVALKRIRLQQARQRQKLDSVLSAQSELLESWASLEQDHTIVLAGATEALESAILRVPVTGGARADLQAVREALGSAYEVMNAVEYSVGSLLPKAEKMDTLLSQLADVAARERTILAECGELLDTASTLEIEQRSLRIHMMQLEAERGRALSMSINGGLAPSDSVLFSSPSKSIA